MKYVDGPHRMAKECGDICISSGGTRCRGISQQSGGQDDPSFEYQFLSPKWLIWWAFVQSDHTGKDGGYAWTQKCRFPFTKIYLVVTLMMVYLVNEGDQR